tara:strand:+ start:617 stop:718 length:102 start_codon:yes stop_codon:yes gene_type:complete
MYKISPILNNRDPVPDADETNPGLDGVVNSKKE